MSNDLLKHFEFVQQVVKSHTSVPDGMTELVGYCEASCPISVWDRILRLDFAKDVACLQAWLSHVLSDEPPAENIKAFWFGLFNPVIAGQTSCDLYLSGSVEFDPEDETHDWACWTDESYLPNGRYAKSQVLHEIYYIVHQSGQPVFPYPCKRRGLCSGNYSCWLGEYVLCLGYACLSLKEVLQSIEPTLLLGKARTRAVVVGYDSGDAILMGNIDRNGWHSGLNSM